MASADIIFSNGQHFAIGTGCIRGLHVLSLPSVGRQTFDATVAVVDTDYQTMRMVLDGI